MNSRYLVALALLACASVHAQVVAPPPPLPGGEARLPGGPDPTAAPPTVRPPDDCRRQADDTARQFEIQERALRREMDERLKLASDAERTRLQGELSQRLADLRLQAAEARRRVMDSCRSP